MPQTLKETAALSAAPVAGKPGRLLVTLITPGQGSSGYYEPAVLEAAGRDGVFPAGTQMFLDHPTESEAFERPERSVKDLGAVLAEDARWDADLQALVAEADTFSQHRDLLTEMQAHIGVSVRAAGEVSEAGGRRNVTQLVPSSGNTVDFVTRAGRGGSFTVLESARPSLVNRRALRHDGVQEATVNDQREALDDVLKSAHGGENTYVWLRDFDATTAWFEISTNDSETTYAQAYETGDNGLASAVTGERTEVRQVTQYVPVSPAGSTTQESIKEDTMKQIEESEFSRLTEAAGRVTVLEGERDTAIRERNEAREALASRERRDAATDLVVREADAASIALSDLEVAGLVSQLDLPVKEGALDTEALTPKIQERLTKLAESSRVRGFGGGGNLSGGAPSTSEIDDLFKTGA